MTVRARFAGSPATLNVPISLGSGILLRDLESRFRPSSLSCSPGHRGIKQLGDLVASIFGGYRRAGVTVLRRLSAIRDTTTRGRNWRQHRDGIRLVETATMRAVLDVLPTCLGSRAISARTVTGLRIAP